MDCLVTCEHGSDVIADDVRHFFDWSTAVGDAPGAVGFDRGAAEISRAIAAGLGGSLVEPPCSPMVIDLNRSPRSRRLFSPSMRRAPQSVRQQLVKRYLEPYRQQVCEVLRRQLEQYGVVIHFAVHAFAPFPPGASERRCEAARRTDLGLLYDPQRPAERAFCEELVWELYDQMPLLRVRRNYPLRGTRDCISQWLRRHYPAEHYLGIELQLNQAWCARDLLVSQQTVDGLIRCLAAVGRDAVRQAA